MVAAGSPALGDRAGYGGCDYQLCLVAYAAHHADLSAFVVEGPRWVIPLGIQVIMAG